MAKSTKQQLSLSQQSSGSRKMTDFFMRKSATTPQSSSQPGSSQPRPSQPRAAKSASKPTRAPSTVAVKKERELGVSSRADQEVISVSSRSDTATHITISSDGSVISISSSIYSSPLPQLISLHEIAPTAQSASPMRLSLSVDALAMVSPRSSPRLHAGASPAQLVKREKSPEAIVGSPCVSNKSPPKGKKRKIAFDNDDDIEMVGADDAIMSPSTPVVKLERNGPSLVCASTLRQPWSLKFTFQAAKRAGRLSPRPRKTPSLKKLKLEMHGSGESSDPEEVIPSSQSDEQELVVPGRHKKDTKGIEASIKAWQKESQESAVLEASAEWDYDLAVADGVDFGVDTGLDRDVEMAPSPPSSSPLLSPHTYSSSPPPAGEVIEVPSPPPVHAVSVFSEAEVSAELPLSTRLSTPETSFPSPPSPFIMKSYSTTPRSPYTRRPLPSASAPPPTSSRSPHASSSTSSLTKVPRTPSPAKFADVCEHEEKKTPGALRAPSVPVALDEQSKTAAIIEQIRAQAFAAEGAASPDPEERAFDELKALSESSSDSEDEQFFAQLRSKPCVSLFPIFPPRSATDVGSV